MKRRITCLVLFIALSLIVSLPHAKAGDITGVVAPGPDIGILNVGSEATLTFGADFSNSTQSMAIILVNYSYVGFNFIGFTAEMNGTDVSGQFDMDDGASVLMLNCSSIMPANGTLNIGVSFEAIAEGNHTFSWRHIYVTYQHPPNTPTVMDIEGQIKIELRTSEPSPPPPPSPPPFFPPFVANEEPIARAGANQTTFENRTIYFDGSKSIDPDGDISSYFWIFGDGSTAYGEVVTHTYSSVGSYTVTLVVMDDLGVSSSDTLTVTVVELPMTPDDGIDENIEANQTKYKIDALKEAKTTIMVNTTDQVTISVLTYSNNPYPEVPLPPNTLSTVVDIAVSNLDAIEWPIHVERYYSDTKIIGLDESKLVLYYYTDGAWHKCHESGVYPEINVVWANMYEYEMTGSPTIIGQLPIQATFELTNLTAEPVNVEPGKNVTISVTVKNIGDVPGNYTINLKLNGTLEDTQTIFLNEKTLSTLSFTLTRETTGIHFIYINYLKANFTVTALPTPAKFKVSSISVSPVSIKSGETVTTSVRVANIGEISGNYTVKLMINGMVEAIQEITLVANASATVSFNVVEHDIGVHYVEINGLSGNFTVLALPIPAKFEISNLELYPKDAELNESINISITVTNVGEESVNYTVEVKVDGATADSRSVALSGGASTSLNFIVSSEEEGSHTVKVDGLTASFTVSAPPDEGEKTFVDVQSLVLIGISLAIIILTSFFYSKKEYRARLSLMVNYLPTRREASCFTG